MSQIKTTGTVSEPAVNTDKELQLARQQAELKGGETLIRELAGMTARQRENVRSSRTDTGQEQPKDTAEISETRRRLLSDGTVPADELLKWVLEMAGEDWEAFLEWLPDPDLELQEQLQELSKLYLTLLEAVLKHAEGDNLKEQLDRLDSLLAQKLNLVIDKSLEQLTSLLEETGQSATMDSIRSSLYRQTAGRTISPQAAHMLFAQSTQTRRAAAAGSIRSHTAPSPFSGEGMIYQSSGKQNVRFRQTYDTEQTSWKEQLRQRQVIIRNAKKGIVENTFRQGNPVSCSARELERANRFAAHIDGSGNLFKNPGISARNEEVTGLLAAVMSIKGQVYTEKNQGARSISFTIERAIERIVHQYLREKEASKIYYRILTAYKQTKDPRKAIEEGQDYALRQFREKQKDPVCQKSPQYSRESGFFRTLLKGLSPEKEFAMGISILQKDWQNFLYSIGNRQGSSRLSGIQLHSPWGLLAGGRTHGTGRAETVGKVLLGAAAAVIVCALALACFRLI